MIWKKGMKVGRRFFGERMKTVPSSLYNWFIIHFVIDYLLGLPLLFFPTWTFLLFGFPPEPLAGRLVGAALLGIGGISLWARQESKEVYLILLKMKLLWSGMAILGLLLYLGDDGAKVAWVFLGVFVFFFGVWGHYYRQLHEQ